MNKKLLLIPLIIAINATGMQRALEFRQKPLQRKCKDYIVLSREQQLPDQATYIKALTKEFDNKDLFNLYLALPFLAEKRVTKYICEGNKAMVKAFYDMPLEKALEWRALMQDKLKNDSRLAQIVTPAELFFLPPSAVITLSTVLKSCNEGPNKDILNKVVYITPQEKHDLCLLRESIKSIANIKPFTNALFIEKNFFTRYPKLSDNIIKILFTFHLMPLAPVMIKDYIMLAEPLIDNVFARYLSSEALYTLHIFAPSISSIPFLSSILFWISVPCANKCAQFISSQQEGRTISNI